MEPGTQVNEDDGDEALLRFVELRCLKRVAKVSIEIRERFCGKQSVKSSFSLK